MQDVYHFFVMVIKNVLEYVHKIIMTQKKKGNPTLKIEGQGAEVSKTLFVSERFNCKKLDKSLGNSQSRFRCVSPSFWKFIKDQLETEMQMRFVNVVCVFPVRL